MRKGIEEFGNTFSNAGTDVDKISRLLIKMKNRYLISGPQTTQKGQDNLYKKRRAVVRPLEIFSEPDADNNERLKCWIQGINFESCIVAQARFNQTDNSLIGYQKMQFNEKDEIVLVSCSVENSYQMFGFKLQTLKENYYLENIEVQAIEGTTVQPYFKLIAPGSRVYMLTDWEDLGIDLKSIQEEDDGNNDQFQFMETEQLTVLSPGLVPVLPQIFVGIKDFNPEDREKSLGDLNSGQNLRILAFRAGELILMTLPPNKGGWFEGYRFNDPDRICGLGHISSLKKVLF